MADNGDQQKTSGEGDDGRKESENADEPQKEETPEEKRRRELFSPENLQRLLADAVTYKSPLKDLETIVRAGGQVNGQVKRGLRPLHYAVHAGYVEGVNFLIDNGADVNAPDDIGYRPVHLCARKGQLEPLKILISHGAKVNFFQENDDTTDADRKLGYLTIEPLNMAIENNHVECARLLLTHGARPDNSYFLGYEINLVPLENVDCLKLLLEFGADPNVFSRCGLTPLMKACKHHSIRTARILLENGADLELQPPSRFEQKTAIHFAIQGGSSGIVNALLRRGAMVARPPGFKYSALHTAVVADSPDMCELVLRWEARVDEITDEGSTALQLACATPDLKNRLGLVRVLLKHGANPNAYSPFFSYRSPFLAPLTEYMRTTTENIEYDIVHALILHGAKVSFCAASTAARHRDPHGILHCVQYIKSKPEVLDLLISAAKVFDLDSISMYTSLASDQRSLLMSVAKGPRDLRTLVHLYLRDLMNGSFDEKVPLLPVPHLVKHFLLFNPSHS